MSQAVLTPKAKLATALSPIADFRLLQSRIAVSLPNVEFKARNCEHKRGR